MRAFDLWKHAWLAVMALLLVTVLLVALRTGRKPLVSQLRMRESVRGMELRLFHDEKDDIYYLFLPAYASKGQVEIDKPEGVAVRFLSYRGGGFAWG
ncbi:MAG: hypothetical protein LUC86_07800, partial [Prevotellaceae bacterium]|nr:hypothetical protein [Prevotellaceae bacterium]